MGLSVAHSGHHKHSYYLIRNSEHLTGFTDHEIEVIAQVARYHRKSAPKDSHPAFAALRRRDQRLVRTLAGILRVAIALDRSRAGAVATVAVEEEDDGAVRIAVGARPGADLSLELFTAEERAGLLADVLDRPVDVVAAAPAPATA